MLRISILTLLAAALIMISCGCGEKYVPIGQGQDMAKTLKLCVDGANEFTKRLDRCENRITNLETKINPPAQSVDTACMIGPAPTSVATSDVYGLRVSFSPPSGPGIPTIQFANLTEFLPPPGFAEKFDDYTLKTNGRLDKVEETQKELLEGQTGLNTQLGVVAAALTRIETTMKANQEETNQRLQKLEQPSQPALPATAPPLEPPAPTRPTSPHPNAPAPPAKPAPTTTGASRGLERNQYTSAPPASGTPHASPNARTFTYPPYMTNSDWYSRQMAEEMADASRNRLYHRPSS